MLPPNLAGPAGIAIKVLTGILALLKFLVTGAPPDATELTGMFGLYSIGSSLTSFAQAKQSTLVTNTAATVATAQAVNAPVSQSAKDDARTAK
jgi:hypothetical protein